MKISEACKFKVIIDSINHAAVAVCKNSGNSFITNSNLRKETMFLNFFIIYVQFPNPHQVFLSSRQYYSQIGIYVATYHNTLSTILII